MNEKQLIENKNSIETWRDLKFGMFIHWGLYSMLGRGEWVMYNEQIDVDEYKKLAGKFTAENFCAENWASLAKDAGMKYMVLTTRHHDGFALWDSPSSYDNFTSINSAAKKDFVKEYTDACRNAGLKVGLYYSPLDWRFPGFFMPGMYKSNAKLLRNQAHAQIKELLTNYGKIDILWYDGGEDYWLCHGMDMISASRPENFRQNVKYPGFWQADKMDKMARQLQNGIITNDRIGAHEFGDYTSPEKKIGAFDTCHPWETCETLTHGVWGYCPGSVTRSLRECIQLLVHVSVAGGNLLLNVGPKGDGSIELSQARRLREVGQWLSEYGESIYGTRGGPIKCEPWGGVTHRENIMYVHICNWEAEKIVIPDIGNPAISSLTSEEVYVEKYDGKIFLSVPSDAKQAPDTILKLVYPENVEDIFKETIDYSSLVPKADELMQALIVDSL